MARESLRELLELPAERSDNRQAANGQSNLIFRDAITGVNRQLQVVAAQTGIGESDYVTLDGQRTRLYEAYQVASSQPDPGRAENAMERVLTAANLVQERAAVAVSNAEAGRDRWAQLESDFDDAMLQVGELEDLNHEKAPVLQQVGQSIRGLANQHRFDEAATAFEQLRPKLAELHTTVGRGDEQTEGEHGQPESSQPEADEGVVAEQPAGQEQWETRQAEFEQSVQQVDELEAAGNPQAPALRQVVDGIQSHANQGRYERSTAAFDRLLPTLNRIYGELASSADSGQNNEATEADSTGEPPAAAQGAEQAASNAPAADENASDPVGDQDAPLDDTERLPSSRGDATFDELNEEARPLYRRATSLLEELGDAVERPELVDFRDRLNSHYGRLESPANAGDRQEVRRVITDLRELISDMEARQREVREHPDSVDAIDRADFQDSGPRTAPSSRENTSFEQMQRQAQQLHQRATELLHLELFPYVDDAERRELTDRLNVANGRINDPELRGDIREMRRVNTDLLAAIQDFERRARELGREMDAQFDPTINDLAEGQASDQHEPAAEHGDATAETDVRREQPPSTDPLANEPQLRAEAEELHARASDLYEELRGRIADAEHQDLQFRLNSVAGRLRDPAGRGSAEETRRVIADLRAFIQDQESRLRELEGGENTDSTSTATESNGGPQPSNANPAEPGARPQLSREQRAEAWQDVDLIEQELNELAAELETENG